MKTNLSQSLLIVLICFLLSCKKSEPVALKPYDANYGTVVINNTSFRTIDIGAQTWTAGFPYAHGSGDIGLIHMGYVNGFILPPGWRIPKIADYNILTANLSAKKDAAGNNYATAADGIDRLLYRSDISYVPSFFFNGEKGGYLYAVAGAWIPHDKGLYGYYLADEPSNSYFHATTYRLGDDFAGIVRLDGRDSLVSFDIRFVKDK
ncbi:hypothetical protein [Mucilaginibacter sp.]|uniref:hypothetical protein n=1 Tax=Mucilaginibacter sp. TaxID=1882438 RepID=UPI00326653C9